jgi:pyruvate/2-oxoglutarate dehydrogenase complex dihydrolipoamide dehydrogenase (E3) component
VGLEPGSWLEVDDSCRVRALEDGWLYALGDVNGHALLTHQGKYQARVAGAAIAARAAGQPIDTAPWGVHAVTADYHAVPQVFGVTFVGPGVEELIHSATMAVAGQVPLTRLWHAVPYRRVARDTGVRPARA